MALYSDAAEFVPGYAFWPNEVARPFRKLREEAVGVYVPKLSDTTKFEGSGYSRSTVLIGQAGALGFDLTGNGNDLRGSDSTSFGIDIKTVANIGPVWSNFGLSRYLLLDTVGVTVYDTATFSVFITARFSSAGSVGYPFIIGRWGGPYHWNLYGQSGAGIRAAFANNAYYTTFGLWIAADQQWHSYVMTTGTGRGRIFGDAVQLCSGTVPELSTTAYRGSRIGIGVNSGYTPYYFTGDIGPFAFFPRMLTEPEIMMLHTDPQGLIAKAPSLFPSIFMPAGGTPAPPSSGQPARKRISGIKYATNNVYMW